MQNWFDNLNSKQTIFIRILGTLALIGIWTIPIGLLWVWFELGSDITMDQRRARKKLTPFND